MMRRNPALVICRGFRGHRWSIGSNDGDLISRINLLRLAGRFLGAFAALASTALLGEQGTDPGAVNEIACASEGSAEKEIEEDTVVMVSDWLFLPMAQRLKDYICGSKMLVSASTTLTVSLNAWTVYGVPSLSVMTAARFSFKSCGWSSVVKL